MESRAASYTVLAGALRLQRISKAAIQVKMETRIMKARSRGPEVFLTEK
jgi:hypothetical protein